MAALAERFVRIRAQTSGFKTEAKKGIDSAGFARMGSDAGKAWGKAFSRSAAVQLKSMKLTVKVTPDFDSAKLPRQKPVKVPMEPDTDKVKAPRVPKAPVELDPLVRAFQTDVARQLRGLSRQVAAKIPVTPETDELRTDLADAIKQVERETKVQVGVEGARDFETKLRGLLAGVTERVRASLPAEAPATPAGAGRTTVPVRLDPLVGQFQSELRRELAATTRVINAQIPVTPETEGLRRELALRIAELEQRLKVKIDVDADGAGALAQLRQSLRELQNRTGIDPKIFADLGRNAGQAGGQVGGLVGSLGRLSGAGGGLGIVAVGVAAIGAAAIAAVPLVGALAGAIASLPALTVGLGAGVGVLALGFAGLADRFKKTAAGGGAASKSLSGLRSATRSVTLAQRELAKATQAVNKARENELERIQDLNREYRASLLGVEDAQLAVLEAQRELNAARRDDDPLAIRRAELAYRQSLLAQEEAADKAEDLGKEKAEADAKGVEGSDQVTEALERQRDAIERLADAQASLAEAQKSAASGGGGGVAKKLMEIAPAAQQAVDAIKAMGPAFKDVRLAVQQELFEGVGAELLRLGAAWKEPLKQSLTEIAGTFNGIFMTLSGTARQPEFISNLSTALGTFNDLLGKVGGALAGPFTRAFGQLAAAAKPFVDLLGDRLAGGIERFSAWIARADENGKLAGFFEKAAGALDDLLGLVGDLGSIGKSFGEIFLGSDYGKDVLSFGAQLREIISKLADFLKDPENQKAIGQLIDGFTWLTRIVVQLILWLVGTALPMLSTAIDGFAAVWARWKAGASNIFNWFRGALDGIVGWVSGLGSRISAAASGMWNGISSAFKGALNTIVRAWNSLSFTVPKIPFTNFGGFTLRVPPVPQLAKGGVVQARPGGRMVNVGEGDSDEAVAPVDTLKRYIAEAVAAGGGSDRPIVLEHTTILQVDGEVFATLVETKTLRAIEKNPGVVAKSANAGNRSRNYVR